MYNVQGISEMLDEFPKLKQWKNQRQYMSAVFEAQHRNVLNFSAI